MIECARVVPVMRSEVTLASTWNTASGDDDAQDTETNNLQEVSLSVAAPRKET